MSGFVQMLRQNRVMTVVLAVFLLLLAFIAWNVIAPQNNPLLEAIRQKGYPTTLAELDAWYGTVPDAENAALRYLEAFGLPAFVEKPGETFTTRTWPLSPGVDHK